MKMRKTLCIALVIALVLSLSPAAYAQSGGADENTLHIKTKAQLIKLAENCSLDTYSEGLTVELDADIDFGDDDFAPIRTAPIRAFSDMSRRADMLRTCIWRAR